MVQNLKSFFILVYLCIAFFKTKEITCLSSDLNGILNPRFQYGLRLLDPTVFCQGPELIFQVCFLNTLSVHTS